MDIKIGQGIDIHKLANRESLILGGIKINSPKGIVGHSDGDIILHALVDSILGALSLGDIGDSFPSNEKKWENVDSVVFLDYAIERMKYFNYRILNTDITIILQSPTIRKYKNKIKQNISSLLNIKINQISIKATTTDRLGFIGEKKGIACFATTLLINNGN